MTVILYHWTHQDNVASCCATGVDPSYSQGADSRAWACTSERVEWARRYIAARHEWDVGDMVLLQVEADARQVKRSGKDGVFYSHHPMRVAQVLSYNGKAA